MTQSASARSEYRNPILVILVVFVVVAIASAKTADQSFSTINARVVELQETAQEPKPADVRELKLAVPIERELAVGVTHSYSVSLTQGQYFKLVVDQKGIDVVIRLFGPNGQKLTEVDETPAAVPESTFLIAEAAGVYRVELESSNKYANPGT